MKRLFVAILIALTFSACSRKEERLTSPKTIDIGIVDSLFSNILNEQRDILVHVPKSKGNFPVIYLLDGDGHFSTVVGMMQHLSGNALCPEMIVVGIPNTDRDRDLTPSKSTGLNDTTVLKTSGGAENFTRFIADELIPYIDKNYPTTPHRTLVGHSFGGLFVTNTLLHHPDLFTNYISIDPSLWWDKRKLVIESNGKWDNETYTSKSLFVGVANTLDPGMNITTVKSDTTGNTEHIRAILQFIDGIESGKGSYLAFKSNYYEQDSHGSVPLISTYDALRHMYAWYAFNVEHYLTEPLMPVDKMMADIKGHYLMVSGKMGYSVLPPESMINSLGYYFLSMKKENYAFEMFRLNVLNYPTRQNVFDSMGDYYRATGDTLKAISAYEKALGIGFVPQTKDKLDNLTRATKN